MKKPEAKCMLFVMSLLLVLAVPSFAQYTTIDSLKAFLKTAKEDTAKINYLNSISMSFINIGEYDKALTFAQQAVNLASRYSDLAAVSEKSNIMAAGLASAYNNMGNIYNEKSNFKKALKSHFKALKIRIKLGDKKGMASSYNNIGNNESDLGNYGKALEYHFKSLKIKEEIGDKKGIGASFSNIGMIYRNLMNYGKALEFHLNSLKIREQLEDQTGIAISLQNTANIYSEQNNYDKALEYYFKSLKIHKDLDDKSGIAINLQNLGSIYFKLGDFDKSFDNYFESLKISEEIGNKEGIAMVMNNIAAVFDIYAELSQNPLNRLENYNKSIEFYKKSLLISKEIGSKDHIKNAYKGLSATYSKMNNYELAYQHQKLYSEVKDSIFNTESNKQITEMQTRYETEKKEKEIQLLHKDKEIQSQELNRQKLIRNAIGGGLLIVFIFALVLINRFLLIRKQKKTIEAEREKSEKLLLNILPKDTAEELKLKNSVTPKHFEMVTVIFTDFKGFTTIAEKMSAEELVGELDFVFKKFDEIISRYPIEKIKTIGDAYMCAGGLPAANTTNPMDVVLAALDIKKFMINYKEQRIKEGKPFFEIRIGVHTGAVVAGVVGDKKFAYDIWGDTVNTASRMESSGEPGKVNISGETYQLIRHAELVSASLQFEFRGKVKAKNKGEIEMWFVDKA